MYRKLQGDREIRLLKFLPGSSPHCKLIHSNIDEAPPYLGLSYTWGPQSLDHAMIIDGSSLSITKNLADAIAALYVYVREQHLMLWVDAVCINQRDIDERSSQVRLMNVIYRSAELVAVWLGKSDQDSDFIMDKMQEWKVEFNQLFTACNTDYGLAVSSILPTNPIFQGPKGSDKDRAWHALELLCQRQWWRRAWIVQEATSNPPSRTVLACGDRRVDWECLRATLHITNQISRYNTHGMSVDFDLGMASRLDGFRLNREIGAHMYLLRVLQNIRCYECQDPRDKIFASLGMAMDVTETDILPDYSKSVASVYMDVARFILDSRDGHALDFLGYVIRSAEDSEYFQWTEDEAIPSWVPDWRKRCCFFAFEKFIEMDDIFSANVYNCSGKFAAETSIQGSLLSASGLVLDVVSEVFPVCELSLAEGGTSVERSWRPTGSPSKYQPTGESLDEAFNRTILADVGRVESDSELSRGFSMDWSYDVEDISAMSDIQVKKRTWMLIDMKQVTFGRRYFRTKGGLMGLAPAAAQPNDTLCVLFGGQVPYVLRERENNTFEFIGESYVHGMMDGEAVKDCDVDGGKISETFIIA